MENRPPGLVPLFTFGKPREVVPAAIVIVHESVRTRSPDDLRHGIGKLAEFPFTFAERGFGSLSGGDVVGDLCEPPGAAVIVHQCGDENAGPEAGAVFAKTPALFPISA